MYRWVGKLISSLKKLMYTNVESEVGKIYREATDTTECAHKAIPTMLRPIDYADIINPYTRTPTTATEFREQLMAAKQSRQETVREQMYELELKLQAAKFREQIMAARLGTKPLEGTTFGDEILVAERMLNERARYDSLLLPHPQKDFPYFQSGDIHPVVADAKPKDESDSLGILLEYEPEADSSDTKEDAGSEPTQS